MSEILEEYGGVIDQSGRFGHCSCFPWGIGFGCRAITFNQPVTCFKNEVNEMKDILEEYGGVIAAALTAAGILALLVLIMHPGNPLGDGVRNLLTATMP